MARYKIKSGGCYYISGESIDCVFNRVLHILRSFSKERTKIAVNDSKFCEILFEANTLTELGAATYYLTGETLHFINMDSSLDKIEFIEPPRSSLDEVVIKAVERVLVHREHSYIFVDVSYGSFNVKLKHHSDKYVAGFDKRAVFLKKEIYRVMRALSKAGGWVPTY